MKSAFGIKGLACRFRTDGESTIPLATARIESGVYTFMIGRIGFRRVLPILLTLVHLTLLYFAAGQRTHHLSRVCSESVYHLAAYQQEGSGAWEPMERKPLTSAQKIAILLNLPAMVLGIPIALVFFHGNNIASLYGAVPFVPLVWSGVGRWLDRLLGHISPLQRERRTWRKVFAVLSTIFLCLGILSITQQTVIEHVMHFGLDPRSFCGQRCLL